MTLLLLQTHKKGLQDLLDKVVTESKEKGLEINHKKTVCMVVSKKQSHKCSLFIENEQIQKVNKFNYLESYITKNGKCDAEIKRRFGIAKEAFDRLEKILNTRKYNCQQESEYCNAM